MEQGAWYSDRRNLIWAAIFCVVPLLGFWAYGLFDLDEGFYGAVARDMMRRGDWITPTLGGEPWFEKPILTYWFAIPFIKLFGEDVGPRLPSVLATLGLCYAIFRWLKPKVGIDQGVSSAVVYGTSLLPVVLGRMFLTDALLVLSLSLCLMFFYDSCQGVKGARAWAGLCLGFAILAKGPVAGLFFLLVAGFFFWRNPTMRSGFKGGWLLGTLLCLGVVAAWYVPCYLANGQLFIDKFLIEQNIGRFAGGDKAHQLPPSLPWIAHPLYYPIVLTIGLIPWLFLLRTRILWEKDTERDGFRSFLTIWFWVVLTFFAMSGSKLPHYILPAVAPMIMLLVHAAFQRGMKAKKLFVVGEIAVPLICLGVTAGFFFWDKSENKDLHQTVKSLRQNDSSLPMLVVGLGRTESKTDFSMEINETSRPSIGFYWPSLTLKGPSLEQAYGDLKVATRMRHPGAVVLTKKSVDTLEMSKAAEAEGMFLEMLRIESDDYRAFKLVYAGPPSGR